MDADEVLIFLLCVTLIELVRIMLVCVTGTFLTLKCYRNTFDHVRQRRDDIGICTARVLAFGRMREPARTTTKEYDRATRHLDRPINLNRCGRTRSTASHFRFGTK
jgi:hypothetical protein